MLLRISSNLSKIAKVVIVYALLWHDVDCSAEFRYTPGLKLLDNTLGGVNNTVVISSTGLFRLEMEAKYNYGISKWFDTVNDASNKTDLAENTTSYLPTHEQGSLFNQVVNPGDLIGHIISSSRMFAASSRGYEVIESNNVRCVLSTTYHPMIGAKFDNSIRFMTRYVIYPTGRVLIRNGITCENGCSLSEWRNSVIGLGDPSYMTLNEAGSGIADHNAVLDEKKHWVENKWFGFQIQQAPYNAWEIIGNSSNKIFTGKRVSGNASLRDGSYTIGSRSDKFGWIRATDRQDPYSWHRERAKYLYMFWDSSTPQPFKDWAKASIMLVPRADNPYQGIQSTHGWKGFKRFYYQVSNLPLKKGETITQHYYLQLGTKGSNLLPDLSTTSTTERYASDYLGGHPIKVLTGAARGSGFDDDKGCYTLNALDNMAVFTIDGSRINKIKPVFEVSGISPQVVPAISLDGKILRPGVDFIWHNDNKGMLLVQFLFDISNKSTISIRPAAKVASSDENILLALQGERESGPAPGGESNKSQNFQQSAILSYTNDSPQVSSWIDGRFSYKIIGTRPANPDVRWMTYFDIYGTGTLNEYLNMKDFALANGFTSENMLLHARKNYTAKIPVAFRGMDRFDAFEGKNGVLRTKDFKKFEDLTTKAYQGNVSLSDTICIGYEEPFAELNWEFSNPGKKVQWGTEYWNGAVWAPLNLSDATDGFTHPGRMTFIPPGNWQPLSVNGSRTKYFIRISFKDADTYPTSSRIYGDNWLNGKNNACRGWDDAAPGIVNSGPLAFNPEPPPGASAKFRYQARIPFWNYDHFVANPADTVPAGSNAVRTWAKYAAQQIVSRAAVKGYFGVMCDDGERNVASDGVKAEQSDLPPGKDWNRESAGKYRDIVHFVKQANPALLAGINSQAKEMVRYGDWNLAEYNTFVWKTGSAGPLGSSNSASTMAYDDYLVRNGEKAVTGVLIYQDTVDTIPGIGAAWDRGNRGPIAALSKHYIGMNSNTVFSYYSRGGYVYDETDEVYLKNKIVLHQSTDPAPTVEDVYRWATWFPAMGIDMGTPDGGGHQGGKRDTAWKKGKEIGGGPDIWRRDFTAAVVLHRPAYYNTTKAEYEGYSLPMPLGAEYYPLRADGTTGPAVKQIVLRAGEGAILMKSPLPNTRR